MNLTPKQIVLAVIGGGFIIAVVLISAFVLRESLISALAVL